MDVVKAMVLMTALFVFAITGFTYAVYDVQSEFDRYLNEHKGELCNG